MLYITTFFMNHLPVIVHLYKPNRTLANKKTIVHGTLAIRESKCPKFNGNPCPTIEIAKFRSRTERELIRLP